MTEAIQPTDLKLRHRKMWASGDYPSVAREVIPRLGERLVAAADVKAGDRVLDVAAGSGNAAIPAAALGAQVVASDLTPELFDAGRRAAAARGVELAWEEGDAEALPYPDGQFDVVLSCVGVMFAPHHQAAADEIVRVARPGGTIALISWTPEGFIGQMFAAMKPYAPAPPPGASPPPMWGSSDHVQELFGARVGELTSAREHVDVAGFASGAQFRDFFKANYGPTIMVYAALADQPHRAAELDSALAELGDRCLQDGQMSWEYQLTTATRS
ncbi:MAG: class I SAM-dependent methyltransferase [Ornithinibacter sp.]